MPADSASNATISRALLSHAGSAALATLTEEGGPFASYVLTAPAIDLAPLLLLSHLAAHSRNLQRDPRASLLYVREPEAGSQAMNAVRLTLTGRLLRDGDPQSPRLFLTRHPDAARYAGFADFSVYRFHIDAGHLVAGFGRIVALSAAELMGEASDAV